MENEIKKEMTKEEKLGSMQEEIFDGIVDVKDLLPDIGHGEAKRLLIATLSYPYEVEDFNADSDSMRRAFSACKRVKDAMIAIGVEVTLESMVKQAMKNGDISNPENVAPQAEIGGEEEK